MNKIFNYLKLAISDIKIKNTCDKMEYVFPIQPEGFNDVIYRRVLGNWIASEHNIDPSIHCDISCHVLRNALKVVCLRELETFETICINLVILFVVSKNLHADKPSIPLPPKAHLEFSNVFLLSIV